ncbi:17599_t:CDS:10, partial [Dentiscutata erythropus]
QGDFSERVGSLFPSLENWMHKYTDHKYFEQGSKWNILGFLDECVLEPLERKVECYIKCLEAIADNEEGRDCEQAKQLLYRYRSPKIGTMIVNPRLTVFNNSLGVASINGGAVIIGSIGTKEKVPVEATSSDGKRDFDSTLDSDLIPPVEVKKIKSTQDPSFNLKESDEQNNGIMKEESQKNKLNSGISSAYEDKDEENSLDDNSDEEDTIEHADILFNSFIGSKTDNKNYKWKFENDESVRNQLIVMTKKAIEEAKQAKKVDSKILSIIRLGLSSIIDLSSEFKGGMQTWFGDNWIPLKKEVLSKIDLKVEKFTGEVSELITKIENLCSSYDYLGAQRIALEKIMERPIDSQMRQIAKIYFNIIDLFLENPYIFIKKDGRPQNHTEIQRETVSQVTNESKRKIDLCIRTEDGSKELSHSEYAREATLAKIIKDQSKFLRTNKCILDKYLESNISNEALNDMTIFGLQLA